MDHIATLSHVKEEVARITPSARIRVARHVWPVIEIEVPFYHVRKTRKLQDKCQMGIKLNVRALGLWDYLFLKHIAIDKSA